MIEQELKLTAANREVLQQVLASELLHGYRVDNALLQPTPYWAHYYDTPRLDLLRQGCTLRARKEGDAMVAALKLRGQRTDGLVQRQEYETPIHTWLQTPQDLPESRVKRELLQYITLHSVLHTRVTVDMQRIICDLRVADSQIELACDQAQISANHKNVTLYEVELELKSGTLEPLLAFGRSLQGEFDLRPSTAGKYQTGLSLYA